MSTLSLRSSSADTIGVCKRSGVGNGVCGYYIQGNVSHYWMNITINWLADMRDVRDGLGLLLGNQSLSVVGSCISRGGEAKNKRGYELEKSKLGCGGP